MLLLCQVARLEHSLVSAEFNSCAKTKCFTVFTAVAWFELGTDVERRLKPNSTTVTRHGTAGLAVLHVVLKWNLIDQLSSVTRCLKRKLIWNVKPVRGRSHVNRSLQVACFKWSPHLFRPVCITCRCYCFYHCSIVWLDYISLEPTI